MPKWRTGHETPLTPEQVASKNRLFSEYVRKKAPEAHAAVIAGKNVTIPGDVFRQVRFITLLKRIKRFHELNRLIEIPLSKVYDGLRTQNMKDFERNVVMRLTERFKEMVEEEISRQEEQKRTEKEEAEYAEITLEEYLRRVAPKTYGRILGDTKVWSLQEKASDEKARYEAAQKLLEAQKQAAAHGTMVNPGDMREKFRLPPEEFRKEMERYARERKEDSERIVHLLLNDPASIERLQKLRPKKKRA